MSIARITMMEYLSEKEVVASENFYQTIQKEWFGNAQTVVNVRTGPTSLLSLAIYSSYEDAEKNLPKRKEVQRIVKNKLTVVDSFYYEADVTYFEGSKAYEILNRVEKITNEKANFFSYIANKLLTGANQSNTSFTL